MNKARLTVTVEPRVLRRARRASRERRIPLSRLVENYLGFLGDPSIYCFSCGEKFEASRGRFCPKCSWLQCPRCRGCGCHLPESALRALHPMRRVFEELAGGRLR